MPLDTILDFQKSGIQSSMLQPRQSGKEDRLKRLLQVTQMECFVVVVCFFVLLLLLFVFWHTTTLSIV